MGVFILGFSVIVNNIRDEQPSNGRQAARNLLYQGFPLTAGIVNAVFIFITFMVTLPGLATTSRKWIKLAGYMAVVCAIFSMILGLYLWIFTLKTRGDFAPLFAAQPENIKSLMQSEVCPPPPFTFSPSPLTKLTPPPSSTAAATSTAPPRPSSPTRRAPARRPRR
jgi:hypothetical protein